MPAIVNLLFESVSADTTISFSLVLPLFSVLALLAGVGGHLLVWLVLLRQRQRRARPSSVLLLNLSLADLGALLALPCVLLTAAGRGWRLGGHTCVFLAFSTSLTAGVDIFSLAAMSVLRHRIVTAPASPPLRPWHLAAVLAVIWLVAVTMALPKVTYVQFDSHCTWAVGRGQWLGFLVPAFLVYYVAPLVTIAVNCGRIVRHLRHAPTPGGTTFTAARRNKKATALLIGSTLAFALSWLPYYALEFVNLPPPLEPPGPLELLPTPFTPTAAPHSPPSAPPSSFTPTAAPHSPPSARHFTSPAAPHSPPSGPPSSFTSPAAPHSPPSARHFTSPAAPHSPPSGPPSSFTSPAAPHSPPSAPHFTSPAAPHSPPSAPHFTSPAAPHSPPSAPHFTPTAAPHSPPSGPPSSFTSPAEPRNPPSAPHFTSPAAPHSPPSAPHFTPTAAPHSPPSGPPSSFTSPAEPRNPPSAPPCPFTSPAGPRNPSTVPPFASPPAPCSPPLLPPEHPAPAPSTSSSEEPPPSVSLLWEVGSLTAILLICLAPCWNPPLYFLLSRPALRQLRALLPLSKSCWGPPRVAPLRVQEGPPRFAPP